LHPPNSPSNLRVSQGSVAWWLGRLHWTA
jgi:hypothetical protein